MVLATTLIGTESMVRQRLGVWRDAGVDTVRLYPAGATLDDRLATLGRAIEIVHEISNSAWAPPITKRDPRNPARNLPNAVGDQLSKARCCAH
jgi:hypothetical protein